MDHNHLFTNSSILEEFSEIPKTSLKKWVTHPSFIQAVDFYNDLDAPCTKRDLESLKESLISNEIFSSKQTDIKKSLVLNLILPFIVSIIAGLLTPHISSLIEGTSGSYTKKTNIDIFNTSYRTTHSIDLAIRSKPHSKSKILGIVPKNTLVQIWGESSRSWLLISVRTNDQIIFGWIYRCYTTPKK